MSKDLAIVLGMSISYIASLMGMFIAMWAYKREKKKQKDRYNINE